MEEMRIQTIKISNLKEYENNPRLNDKAVDAVANSIKEFGFKVPIIIDTNNVIVAGHTRLKACIKLGIDEVPCIVADDINEEQLKAFRLVDNKTAELADWDDEKLKGELELLTMDMIQFGFEDLEEVFDREVLEDDFDENEEVKRLLNEIKEFARTLEAS